MTIDIDGTTINYEETGEGSPLILMHGWGCNHTTVASIASVASETHKVYNLDMPGFGDSPEPPAVWGVEEYTRAVEAFCKKLGIVNPVLMGHSFGGRVAIVFASRNKTDKVILVDAAGVKPKRKPSYYYKVYSFKLSKALAKALLPKKKAEELIQKQIAKRSSADYKNATPTMRAILSKVVNEDLKHLMPLISAPTLLVWGEKDTATPMRDAHIMEKLIPNSGLVSFKDASHYSFLDNPYQFAAVLRSFLRS